MRISVTISTVLFCCIIVSCNRSDSIAIRYNIKATPSTWLVDRTGTLRYYNPEGAELEQLICKLLKE